VGVALEAAYNRPGLDAMVYGKPAILVLGYLARFGFVAALLARWASLSEPRALGDLRRLDGADTLVGYVVGAWPRLLAAAGAAAAVVGVLSMSELVVAARLAPPRFPLIAGAILNAVHYQRPDTVLLAVLGLIGCALAATLIVVGVFEPLRRGGRVGVLLAAATVAALGTGCGSGQADPAPSPLETKLIFGSSGRSLGQFQYPRGVAVDRTHQALFVVDKSARVQRWSFDGRPQLQWQMPKWDNGKPTGLGVSPDGRVFVADTHYHRVIAFDAEGRELMRFGSYGSGPGEFIYPTDVAFGPEGHVYVSEYGGNERIGVFSSDGEFLFAFGEPGAGPGQYNRPQSMAFSADLSELYIADACNHRIVVVNPAGEPLRVIGTAGRGQGELAYPYDVCVLDDGTLLVCEFGNNRIQRFSPDGRSRGMYGRVGSADGELQYPWGIDAAGDMVFVLDSGNNRVQVLGRRAISH
jgi:DNA-binding beta-propeller fold protein YncE